MTELESSTVDHEITFPTSALVMIYFNSKDYDVRSMSCLGLNLVAPPFSLLKENKPQNLKKIPSLSERRVNI